MKVKVYHNGQLINWRIPADSFPDIAMSFKGDGCFDFEVEPVSFKVNRSDLNVKVNDSVLMTDESGNVLVNGYIDKIGDELSNPIEITVFPQSLKLKDILAGEEVIVSDDPDNVETAVDYKTEGYKSVRDIVKDLVNQAKIKTGWDFSTSVAAIPDPAPSKKRRYFANILDEIPLGKISLSDEYFELRGKSGVLYLVSAISGLRMEVLLKKGLWEPKVVIPGKDIEFLGVTIKEGSWLNKSFVIPGSDIKAPKSAPAFDIYRCEYGGLSFVERLNGNQTVLLNDKYGERIETVQYENVSEAIISQALKDMGYVLSRVYAVVDTDSFNTYALVKVSKRYNDFFGRYLLLSLETASDFYYQAHYRNKSIMDILKDLAVITGRYLYIDSKNTIYLLPRDNVFKTVQIDRRRVIKLNKESGNQEEVSISVNRYVENEDGEPTSFGIKLRDNEWSNIEAAIKKAYKGPKTEYTWEVLNPPADLGLMRDIIMDVAGYGKVIRMSINHIDEKAEFTTEAYDV